MAIVLHPFMLGWLGAEHLAALLDRVACGLAGRRGLGCALRRRSRARPRRPGGFGNGAVLDYEPAGPSI